jgi:RNA polymerase sigma-70 factor (ECF subfamily)
VDSAPPQSAGLDPPFVSVEAERLQEFDLGVQPERIVTEASVPGFEELWVQAEAERAGLDRAELAEILRAVGARYNHGLPPGVYPSSNQAEGFYRALQLRELALAHACALGRDLAWQQFLARFREPLTQAAVAITGSASLGRDLADSLYSELFGLTERDGERRSPLASYSGRGSLMGWLRTTLAQRHVDHHRRTYRETALDRDDFAAASPVPTPSSDTLSRLDKSLTVILRALEPEERFMLSAWFLDRHTLLEISRLLLVHEATVSRKLKRLTEKLHKQLLQQLQAGGISKRAAEEALGTDPRDLSINLRNLLQTSNSSTFYEQAVPSDPEQA